MNLNAQHLAKHQLLPLISYLKSTMRLAGLTFIFTLIISLFGHLFFQEVLAKKGEDPIIQQMITNYSQKKSISFDIEIKTEKKVLGTQTLQKGLLKIKNKNFALLLSGDKKIDFLFDGKKAVVINYPDQELDPQGKRKVIKISKSQSPQIELFTQLFTSKNKINKSFNVKEISKNDKSIKYSLTDIKNKVKPFIVVIDPSDLSLKEVQYSDEVDNETQIKFLNQKFNITIEKNIFVYNKKSSDEVIEK